LDFLFIKSTKILNYSCCCSFLFYPNCSWCTWFTDSICF